MDRAGVTGAQDRSRPNWNGALSAIHPIGALLALIAGLRHAVLMTRASSDNFLHLTLAQQLLAGDWPVRDFFDGGWVLQYVLSATAQVIVGNRLLAEALVVAAAWALSTYFVFNVVRAVSHSTSAAMLAGVVMLLADARGYSYPKAIVYAVAAVLWWKYVRTPTRLNAASLGLWAAVAFYWRPDHGAYVAVGIVLATLAVHGVGRRFVENSALAGGVMLALVSPFMVYVQLTVGLLDYARTGLVTAQVEHNTQGPHAWPIFRFAGRIFTVDPEDEYGPVVTIRWSSNSSPADRARLLTNYGLHAIEQDGESLVRVRLSRKSLSEVRRLINETIVEDTSGIDRSTATLLPASWPAAQQLAFRQPWRRIHFLPDLDDRARLIELIVGMFYVLPILMACAAPFLGRHAGIAPRAFVAFAGFVFLVNLAMLRLPFAARVFDAVTLSAIVLGCCLVPMGRGSSGHRRVLLRMGAAGLALTLVLIVGRAGQFTNPLSWGSSLPELTASPPLAYFIDRPARFTLQLAAYVRGCVPPADRLLVLWFEPEIYFYSERLMAQRHLVFAPPWVTLAHEQRMTLDKVKRFAPPIALARRSALESYARATFPDLIDYVQREYHSMVSAEEGGEEYLFFVRHDRQVVRTFGSLRWPCLLDESSSWSRVGLAVP